MTNEEKANYRRWAKEIRESIDLKNISAQITSKIKDLSEYKSAKNVMSYLAKDNEISINDLFEDKIKNWFLPVVGILHLKLLRIAPYIPNKTKLIMGKFDVLEPEITDDNFFDQIKEKIKLDVIFVPGLCFDKNRNRIGFGMGYYDNFLKLNKDSFKVGCCPKRCLVDNLPCDEWDEKVDLVITD